MVLVWGGRRGSWWWDWWEGVVVEARREVREVEARRGVVGREGRVSRWVREVERGR